MDPGGGNTDADYSYDADSSDGFQWPSRFCGDPLWIQENFGTSSISNASETAILPLPALTQCLMHAVLAELAPAFLLLTLPVLWTQLAGARRELHAAQSSRKHRTHSASLPWDALTSLRNLLTIALFGLKFLLLLKGCYEWLWEGQDVPIVEFLFPVMHMATLTAILHYSEQYRRVGLVSPGPIFCTWLLFVLAGAPEFVFWLRTGSDPTVSYLIALVWWPLCCVQLFLHFFAGKIPAKWDEEPNASPEPRASFFNRQFFFWLDPMIWRGHRAALTESDVFRLEPALRAQRLFQRWSGERERQMKDYQRRETESVHKEMVLGSSVSSLLLNQVGTKCIGKDEEHAPLLLRNADNVYYGVAGSDAGSATAPDGKHRQAPPSIVACLWRLFRWEITGAMVAKVCSDLLQFASPLLLGQLIAFTEEPNVSDWYGYGLAATLFFASELRSLFMNNYFVLMNSIGCQVQSVLTSAVYAKTLRLSSAARRGRTSGEIQNLMAIDVDRFQQITPILQQIWSSPLQVVVALVLLYQTIGWAAIGGILVMLALIPCNLVVVRFTKRWQMDQMACKDKRLRITNEVLSGIRAVKLYAWEAPMMAQIEQVRQREIQLLRRAALLRTTTEVLNITSPFFVAIISFALYTLPDPVAHPLTPEVAFVSLTLFSQLRVPMMVLAETVAQLVQCTVSNRRLKEFLVAEEVDPSAVARDTDPAYERAIDVEFASFDWHVKDRVPHEAALAARRHHRHSLTQPTVCLPYTLNNIELHIRRGLLVAVVGKVGAGKSSLLSAILGEMHRVYGYVGVRGSVAYVPQQPWILNRTVRDNILFTVNDHEPVDEQRYARVVEACALSADFGMLPNGDRTEIGEKGINLSGGQKARLNLARALYRRTDILLLDDPLSAVDALVGRHLFDRAIGPESMAKDSTRVLVTHSLAYLSQCDWIVVMEDGQVRSQGTYADLLQDEETARTIARLESEEMDKEVTDTDTETNGNIGGDEGAEEVEKEEARSAEGTARSRRGSGGSSAAGRVRRRHTRHSTMSSSKRSRGAAKVSAAAKEADAQAGKLVREEQTETGHVAASVYRDYFRAMGWPLFVGFVLFMFAYFVAGILQSFWLSAWSDDNSGTVTQEPTSLDIRFGVYAALGIAIVVFMALSSMCQIMGSVHASRRLHGPLLDRVLHAPVSFYDTTPLGRVLNRFGKEFDTVDLRLSGAFRFLVISLLSVLQVMLIVAISTPLFVLIDIPITVMYIFILIFFLPTSRQLQRLTSVTRSPLYNLFAETINGVNSIRAYGVGTGFFGTFCAKLDTQIGCKYFALMANRWLSIRLELIGNIVILTSAALAVLSKQWGTVTAGLIGLSVSRSLDITFMLGYLVRNINDMELSVVSVERILEYMHCPQEAAWHSPVGQGPPRGWPVEGSIRFQKFSCRYRPGLELSLRSITAEIRPWEKVGVVGRTGAGKTSMVLALFRIIEAADGWIMLDGVDIARIGLQELRSRITIIPQDPVLFSGTLRFNLDPFGVHTDVELWQVLEHVHLKEFVQTQARRLDHQITEGGENISVGQRQLLCLARAILRRSTVIVLDEATASIDAQTDALIQKTIRAEFKHSTVITIAHRIGTVLDYDRIMVLSGGRLVEFDTPGALRADKRSLFHELVRQSEEHQE